MVKINFKGKVTRIGDSFYLLLKRNVREYLSIKDNDFISFDGDAYKTEEIYSIVCPECNAVFDDSIGKDVYDCPVCNKEIISSEVNS